jgi:hypothetical protein
MTWRRLSVCRAEIRLGASESQRPNNRPALSSGSSFRFRVQSVAPLNTAAAAIDALPRPTPWPFLGRPCRDGSSLRARRNRGKAERGRVALSARVPRVAWNAIDQGDSSGWHLSDVHFIATTPPLVTAAIALAWNQRRFPLTPSRRIAAYAEARRFPTASEVRRWRP